MATPTKCNQSMSPGGTSTKCSRVRRPLDAPKAGPIAASAPSLNSLEGAFILAKLRRDPGPLLSTGEAVALLADSFLTAPWSDT